MADPVAPKLGSANPATGQKLAVAGIAVAIGSYGFAFGVLAAASGLSWLAVFAMSALAYSGGAQAAFVSALVIGSPSTALLSGALVNLRLGIYGAIANRILATEPLSRRLVGVHLAGDENIALASAADNEAQAPTYWLSGIAFFVTWVVCTLAGALIGDGIGDPQALGLDVAFPAVFVALLLPMLDSVAIRVAAVAAAVVTLAVTPVLTAGLPILGAAGAALVVSALAPKPDGP